jgi:hypothetical protein
MKVKIEKFNVIVTFDTDFISLFRNRLRPSYIYEQFISSSNFKLNGVTGSVFLQEGMASMASTATNPNLTNAPSTNPSRWSPTSTNLNPGLASFKKKRLLKWFPSCLEERTLRLSATSTNQRTYGSEPCHIFTVQYLRGKLLGHSTIDSIITNRNIQVLSGKKSQREFLLRISRSRSLRRTGVSIN